MYDKNTDEALRLLSADAVNGLCDEEASKRREKYGANILPVKKKVGTFRRFLSQFSDLMIVILLIAAAISFVLALYNKEKSDLFEPLIIVAIVIINAVLGTVQENRAEKSLEALSKLTSPKTKVIRCGVTKHIDSSEVTVGDIVLLEAGDIITADCRLLDAYSLEVNESSLTGEALPVEKNAAARLKKGCPLAERKNCVFGGCFVTSGHCKAVVYAVGINTQMGKIARLLTQGTEIKTPLQQKLRQLSKVIGAVCIAVCAVVMVVGFVKGVKNMNPSDSVTDVFMSIFMTSVSLAVAAIPEGLPAVVTIVLSRGIEQMVSKNAVIKTLPAVETLGSATVICTDKTGTLTQNRMTLTGVFCGDNYDSAEKLGRASKKLVSYFALCCDAEKSASGVYFGDPTEIALVAYATRHNLVKSAVRLFELPFDSERKMMTVVVRTDEGYFALTKGSFDSMSVRCRNLSPVFSEKNKELSDKGLRVLALSVKKVGPSFVKSYNLENNLEITGLCAVADPPRSEAAAAVKTCLEAGIRPVMITGDGLNTAREIATKLGILQEGDLAVDGNTLSSWSDAELKNNVGKVSVYARVTPKDKLRIVEAWQGKGDVVAMTGDGVNDAPALKRADIGCAMGKSGTEVAKNAADMILTDDDFSTIVDAVSVGRGVYDNIKKCVKYLLACNIGEVLSVFLSLFIWNVSPLCAMQLLWINLVTDGLPSLALGISLPEPDIMKRLPKRKNDNFFSNGQGRSIALYGVMFAVLTLIAYAVGNVLGEKSAGTMAFLVLSLSQLFFALEVSSDRSLFKTPFSWFSALTFAVGILLVAVVTFVPFLAEAFALTALGWEGYLAALGLSVVPIPVCETAKLVIWGMHNKKLQGSKRLLSDFS